MYFDVISCCDKETNFIIVTAEIRVNGKSNEENGEKSRSIYH